MSDDVKTDDTAKQADTKAPPVERLVMLEPPFCARCGGTCECEDYYDDEVIVESDYCDCVAEHDDEEEATNHCKCCGGFIQA